MRLLITTDTVGGVWRFTQELVQGLLEASDSVALVSFGRAESVTQRTECELLARTYGDRFRYVSSPVPLEWMRENERSFEDGASILDSLMKDFDAELLHSNQFCFGAVACSIPKIVTAHSDVLSWARACRGEALEDSAWLRRYREMVQRGLNGADAIAAPTRAMLQALAEGFLLPEQRIVIPNGRSLPPINTSARLLRAVTAARLWDEAKDVRLLGAVPSPIPLVVAGETECNDVKAQRLDGADLRGPLGEKEVLELFAESAVYVCTSRYEPFGLAPLEAALSGCAVVARDIDSLNEVWASAALYFRDATELSRLLRRLAEEPGFLHQMQQRAGARARLYTRRTMTEQYRALYASVLTRESAFVR